MRITITEMGEILHWADIDGYLDVPQSSEELLINYIRAGYKWLDDIYQNEYKKVLNIWKLLPKAIWERYKTWGDFSEHRESVLLKEAIINFKKTIKRKSRPDFFKKGNINAKIKAIIKKRSGKKTRQNKGRVSKTK